MSIDKKAAEKNLVAIVLVLIAVISMAPLLWMFLASFKTEIEMFSAQPRLLPQRLNFDNYREILIGNNSRIAFLLNSLIISITATFIVLLIAAPAAFGFAKFRIRKKDFLEFWILSTRMMPPIAALIPLSIIIRRLNLFDTHVGMIILYILFNLPYAIWMLTIFMRQLSPSLDEAAMLDGCSWGQVYRLVALPQLLPAIFTVATFVFVFSWNELLFALILTGRAAKTLPVAITEYAGGVFIRWELMAASATLQIIPAVLIVIFFQKYLISGLSLGSVKG